MGIQRYEYHEEDGYPWNSGIFDSDDGEYVLHTDYEQDIAAKDAEIAALDKENIVMRQQMEKLIDERDALKAAIAPILAHADAHDYAPPLKFSVQQCRDIKEKINGI